MDRNPEDNPFAKIGILPSRVMHNLAPPSWGNGLPVSYLPRRRHPRDRDSRPQETERTTNYLNALDESYFEIRTEMREANEEDRQRSDM